MASVYTYGMWLTVFLGTELVAIAMLFVAAPMSGFGHGFGFFYGISIIACWLCPVFVALACLRLSLATWGALALFLIAAIGLALSEIVGQGRGAFADFWDTQKPDAVVWFALFCVFVMVLVAMSFATMRSKKGI